MTQKLSFIDWMWYDLYFETITVKTKYSEGSKKKWCKENLEIVIVDANNLINISTKIVAAEEKKVQILINELWFTIQWRYLESGKISQYSTTVSNPIDK